MKVKTTTPDSYYKQRSIKPNILKIDVEGVEDEVLKRSRSILETFKPAIIMEVWRSLFDYVNHLKAIEFLKELRYKSHRINHDGTTKPMAEIVPDKRY